MSFAGYLRADTQTNVTIGPVVAVGDGYTPVTNLSLSTADEAELIKHNATTTTSISALTMAAITGADGYYALTLTAAVLDTEGRVTVAINDDSLCLPVRADFMVQNANVYDSLHAAATTDYLQVDAIQISGDATAADNCELMFDGTGYAGGTTKLGVDAVAISGDTTAANNAELAFDGTGYGFTNCTIPTVTTLTGHTPQTGDSFARIGATGSGLSSLAPAATALTNATWTDARAGYLTAAVATATELAKVPKSDGTSTWNSTALASINAEVDTALNTAVPGSPVADSINERIKAIDDLTQASGNGDLAAILIDTAEIGAAGAGLTAVPWNGSWDAEVESECTDAINNLTLSEMAQGAPGATPSLPLAINYLYRMWRNKTQCTASELSMFDDAGTTKLVKSTISDNATTFEKGEFISGA